MPMTQVYSAAFTLASGTANTRVDIEYLDLSHAKWIRLEVELTARGSGADAADTLSIYLQESSDDATPTWDDRARMLGFTADMTVSAAAPEKRFLEFWTDGIITAPDASYEPSGSAGASRLAAGAFLPGPLKGKRRVQARAPRHRISYEVVDADSDSTFTGTTRIFILT